MGDVGHVRVLERVLKDLQTTRTDLQPSQHLTPESMEEKSCPSFQRFSLLVRQDDKALGITPLMRACAEGRLGIVRTLLVTSNLMIAFYFILAILI